MHWKHILKTSLRALAINKSRSLLTILGIVIGISSIMLIMSLGEGARQLILGQVQGIGSRTIAILPGRQPSGPSDAAQMFTDSLKQRDIDALLKKENVPDAELVMPLALGADTASYENETYRATIFGATEAMPEILDFYTERGSFYTSDDVKEFAANIVIGKKIQEKLFANEDPIGKKLRIKEKNFRIIGVLALQGSGSLLNFDESILIPYTTAQQYIFGTKYFNRIIVQVSSESVITPALLDIENTLRSVHDITDPSKDDFFAETSADLLDTLSVITTALTLLLSSLAAISLVVGGIGIMNIMLVSVTERTREIGLRKAIGATEGDILEQFLVEAILLTSLGGLIGVALGTGLSSLFAFAINKAGINWTFVFPLAGAMLGIGSSVLLGLIFGIYPARRAARMEPIEALRFE
ncbi:MAG: ABC transporter permease [Candidatus Paceibacterota bacterium]|jgi:putative ABC transport system permease protein|nr:ABC transporter permease [Candidatus Paceibacterota bacterium]